PSVPARRGRLTGHLLGPDLAGGQFTEVCPDLPPLRVTQPGGEVAAQHHSSQRLLRVVADLNAVGDRRAGRHLLRASHFERERRGGGPARPAPPPRAAPPPARAAHAPPRAPPGPAPRA